MSSSSNQAVIGQGASAPKQYRSRMMEYFQLQSPHRGPYVSGTVSTQARTATITAKLDEILRTLDDVDDRSQVSITAPASKS